MSPASPAGREAGQGARQLGEVIEEETSWIATSALYLAKVRYEETEPRSLLKQTGAHWSHREKAWMAAGEMIRRLGIEDRVVTQIEPEQISTGRCRYPGMLTSIYG